VDGEDIAGAMVVLQVLGTTQHLVLATDLPHHSARRRAVSP
jgi:hypothetical protein